MNGQELVDLTIAKLVPITDPEQAANVNTPFVLAAVNEAYHTVERAMLWKYSEAEVDLTSVVGQQAYTEAGLDPSMLTIQHIWDPSSREELMFLDERQRYHDFGESTGVPCSWSRWNGSILLFPTPSVVRTYKVRYYAQWNDLTLATEPVFPSMYHDMLTDWAAATLALRMPPTGDRFLPNSRAQPYRETFSAKLDQMIRDPRTFVTQDEVVSHAWTDYVATGEHW